MTLDKFGITQLNESVGLEWFSNWDNGHARTINSQGVSTRNQDPDDPMVDFHCLSYSSEGNQFIVYGNGQAKLRGKHPRLYVNKSTHEPLWLNTEATIYGKFTKCIIQSGSYTTYRLASRSNHQDSYICQCNGKGYASEIFIRQDTLKFKDARFRKELIHPHYANKYWTSQNWDMTKWLGLKFICKTDSNNNVISQTWLDKTDGLNGGNWIKTGEFIDTGTNWAITESKELENIEKDISGCTSGCLDSKPVPPYNEKILRKGASCYLRTDFIQDSYFKKFSIREI